MRKETLEFAKAKGYVEDKIYKYGMGCYVAVLKKGIHEIITIWHFDNGNIYKSDSEIVEELKNGCEKAVEFWKEHEKFNKMMLGIENENSN